MRARLLLIPALAAMALTPALAGAAAKPAPQIVDMPDDANGLNMAILATAVSDTPPFYGNNATPAGSQAFADVLSVTWTPTSVMKKKKKVITGFTVTTVLKAPPVPPAGRGAQYRMLGVVKGDQAKYLGPMYHSRASDAPPGAQSALRDNLGSGGAVRLTPLPLPKIVGSTITWTIPLKAVPKEFELKTKVTNLYFETREVEKFPATVPNESPLFPGATGLASPAWDNGKSTASFVIG